MAHRLGIDIGGTFTDFALVADVDGTLAIHKQPTTPHDPSEAVLDGIGRLLADRRVPIEAVTSVVHGSTLVTNAVIERKGAVTGMLVTRGFRDALDIAMERRYDVYDLAARFPKPLVPRHLRAEVGGRLRDDGREDEPLDEAEVETAVRGLVEGHGIAALAICFIHSFTNPIHENAARAVVERAFPDLHVSGSADVFPFMREYERWTTTTVNAYSQPLTDRYLGRLEQGLAALGFSGAFTIMTSSGGTVTTDMARRYPVRMLESGPAAGVLMAAHHGGRLGLGDVLSFDMGGTTAKGSIVRAGVPLRTYEFEIARVHEFKAGSGLPVKVPAIDMIEIGAGGGGIAEPDDRGVIRVGPHSAGADPGPACYGRGGTRPTLTDANLALGFLDPGFFLGGDMALDRDAAIRAIREGVADPLDLDPTRAAWGIHEVINEDVARAFRVHASELGFDYRRCTMVAFGGSGPAHAMRIARKLRIPRVVFPSGAGVMSAIGMLVSPLSFQVARSHRTLLAGLGAAQLAALFEPLVEEASDFLRRAGVDPDRLEVTRRLDVRYHGQGHELEVTLPDASPDAVLASVSELFSRRYEEVFSQSRVDQPLEIVNMKVDVQGPAPGAATGVSLPGRPAAGKRKGARPAYFPDGGGFVETPVYDRYALGPGDVVAGPALIEEREATCVIGFGDTVTVDARGHLRAEIEAMGEA